MTRIRVSCLTCGTQQARPPAAVTLVLRWGKTPAYAFVCIECADECEREATSEYVEALMEARCPIDHDAATVELMKAFKADLEGTT